MSTNNGNHQEGNALPPDYQRLAEQAIGQQLAREYQDVEDAHHDLWSALVFTESETHIGPTDFSAEQVEQALDAVAAYEWYLRSRIIPLLPADSLSDRFAEE